MKGNLMKKAVIAISTLGIIASFPAMTLAKDHHGDSANHDWDMNWTVKPAWMSEQEWQDFLNWRASRGHSEDRGDHREDRGDHREHKGDHRKHRGDHHGHKGDHHGSHHGDKHGKH